MSDIKVALSSSVFNTPSPERRATTQQSLPPTGSTNLNQTIDIRSQAKYFSEVDKYLSALSPKELDQALSYLLQSDDPFQVQAADYFKKGQDFLNAATIKIAPFDDKDKDLLNTGFILDKTTEIALTPPGVDVFRLDGKTNFNPVIFGTHNTALNKELDVFEANSKGVLGNIDFANLFGSVRNALVFSENIMLSFDDVLHFNYGIEKAREAINFINAPNEMKTKLTDILNRSIAHQNSKQSQALSVSQAYVSNSRVGNVASENIRLGLAAQRLNGQIRAAIERSDTSILDSQALLNNLLADNPELKQFGPEKIEEAISFYKQDYEKFERALNGELSTPTVIKQPDFFDEVIIEFDSNYTIAVIENIKAYVAKP